MKQSQRLTESQLHSLFAPYGEVSGVSMPQAAYAEQQDSNDPNAKRKGFAFVHFSGTDNTSPSPAPLSPCLV